MTKHSQDVKSILQDITCAPSYSYKTAAYPHSDLWLRIQ